MQYKKAAMIMQQGGVIAYPTEAVFGFGCDPWNKQAVLRLLQIKQRPWQKGLIIIAASIEQLSPFVATWPAAMKQQIFNSWPGPNTWLVPAAAKVPKWVNGGKKAIAVRVTNHPGVKQLCSFFDGAIISTSANIAASPPLKDYLLVHKNFAAQLDFIIDDYVGEAGVPTTIRCGISGEIIRA